MRNPIINGNKNGSDLEKSGDIKKAISNYEKTTEYIKNHIEELSPHIPTYGIDRLIILYRKNNKEKEKTFLKNCIEIFMNKVNNEIIEKWQTRLDKLS